MARRNEAIVVYVAGLIQGLALVTFPAASTIFTSPTGYGLSSTQYGAMFLPQAIAAIVASLLSAGLTRRLGIKRIYLLGIVADLASMILLVLSHLLKTDRSLTYAILLAATASLGIGFGLTVPSLNTYAAAFFPQRIDRAVLMLNALLGLGTALAPVLVAIFVGLGIWWGLPVLVAVLLLAILLVSLRLPLQAGSVVSASPNAKASLPRRFWIFAAFALLYGIVETMNGNWASLTMTKDLGATTAQASLALAAFWGMVTAGRMFFASIEKRFPEARTYHLLPFVAAAAFVMIAVVGARSSSPYMGILLFGLSGLGCSALLPLTISFGQEELVAITASVAGGLIAFYQMGYGIAAFGVGPIEEKTGLSLSAVYGIAACVALVMAAVSFIVVRRRTASEPQPA